MGAFFASLHILEWLYLAFFSVGLIYALFLAIFGLGHGHDGLEHAGDLDIGHGDVHLDVGHGDVHLDIGHGDVQLDIGHVDDIHVDIGHAADLDVDLGDAALDHAVELDAHGAGEHILPFSPVVIATFVGGFGGFGILATRGMNISLPLSVLVALPAGLLLGGVVFALYYYLVNVATSSSHVRWHEMRGTPARVVTPIPEGGLGEIVYEARGSRYSSPARAIHGGAVDTGEYVTVLDVEDSVAIVDLRYID